MTAIKVLARLTLQELKSCLPLSTNVSTKQNRKHSTEVHTTSIVVYTTLNPQRTLHPSPNLTFRTNTTPASQHPTCNDILQESISHAQTYPARSPSAETDKETKKVLFYEESLARGCFHRQKIKLDRENVKKKENVKQESKEAEKPGFQDEQRP